MPKVAVILVSSGVYNGAVDDILISNTHKVVTTTAYMLASNLVEADASIAKLVKAVLTMTK